MIALESICTIWDDDLEQIEPVGIVDGCTIWQDKIGYLESLITTSRSDVDYFIY